MALCRRTLNKILENQLRSIQTSTKNLNNDEIPNSFSTKLDEKKERGKNFVFKADGFIFDASKFRLEVLKSDNKNLENVSFQLNPDSYDDTNYTKNNWKSINNKTSIDGIKEALLKTELYKNYNKSKKRKQDLRRFTKNLNILNFKFQIYSFPFNVFHELLLSVNKILN